MNRCSRNKQDLLQPLFRPTTVRKQGERLVPASTVPDPWRRRLDPPDFGFRLQAQLEEGPPHLSRDLLISFNHVLHTW